MLTLVDQRQQHVAAAYVGARIGPHIGDLQAVRDPHLLLLLGREFSDDDAEPVGERLRGLLAARRVSRRDALFLQLADGDGELARRALAPDLRRSLGTGASRADQARQVARILHRLAVEADDDVRGLDSRLVGGLPFSTEFTSAPRGRSSPKEVARSRVTSWITTPMRPRATRPLSRNCFWMSSATSIGIANDRPMKPPVRL